MINRDYHLHTNFSDGENSPEEMILTAIEKGMEEIGFSDHSYTTFEDCNIPLERIEEYKKTIKELKTKYRDKISVLCGIEQDYYSEEPVDDYDYVIGSVHNICENGEYYVIDYGAERQLRLIHECFHDDPYAFAERYYELVSALPEKTNCSIIGHFDLIMKYNEKIHIIDETEPRYIAAWKKAADKLLSQGMIFEWNTGAIARGSRTVPYPSNDILMYLRENNAKMIASSDSHSKQNICYYFENYPMSESVKLSERM